jgi:hypothetical protein
MKIGMTGASSTGTALNITQGGTGLALRINDDGTYADSTPFVVDAGGNVGIGTASPQQVGNGLTMLNSTWMSAVDSASTGYVNMFQVNSSNQIQVGAALNVDGGIVLPTDGGQVTLADMGFSSTGISPSTPESYTLAIGAANALTVYGENDGSGNAQNVRVAIGSSITPAYTLDVGGIMGLGVANTTTGAIVFKGSGGAGTLTLAGPTTPNASNYTLTIPAITGNANVCTDNSVCSGYASSSSLTLQNAYNNSSTPELTLDATRGALTIRDNSTPLGANLFEVQNNAGTTTYFGVTATGVSTSGTLAAGGNVTGGTYNTNTFTGSLLTFGAASSATVQSASGQSLSIFGQNGLSATSGGTSVFSINTSNVAAGSGSISIVTGDASAGTSGNVGINVGSSSSGAGTINIGTVARNQIITIGNSTSTSAVTLGGVNAPLTINSTNFKVSSAGAITGATTIAASSTITGTTLNGTTGINTGATAGTQRIDSSGNLVNIGNLTTTGASTFTSTGSNGFTFKPGTDNTYCRLVHPPTTLFLAVTTPANYRTGNQQPRRATVTDLAKWSLPTVTSIA